MLLFRVSTEKFAQVEFDKLGFSPESLTIHHNRFNIS